MDCKDLMVGDLVYVVRGYDKHLTIEKIKGVIEDEDKPYPVTIFTSETVSLNDIKPIPLTEDILVKNGFDCQYYDDGNSYWWAVFDGWFNINFDHSDCSEGEFRCVNFRDLVIKSVHQLQHLLRLVGIEKEIEL